ncbi:hypothetical protein V9K67_04015 [Paraflavisolibacter sp. H34]|uniref:hypothetical protein n=1 Tax=Huijunlia imazamoxiresistens TaxID=3127457 RepID=UPI00301A2440
MICLQQLLTDLKAEAISEIVGGYKGEGTWHSHHDEWHSQHQSNRQSRRQTRRQSRRSQHYSRWHD